MIKEILKLGNPLLYEVCEEVTYSDKENLNTWINDLHDTLINFKNTYHFGRAIASPQIGIKKRLIYMNVDDKPYVFVNPKLIFPDNEKFVVSDDCMSFPGLFVNVKRFKNVKVQYKDENFNDKELFLSDDLAQLIQHEYDHLDGILATMRATDNKSFFMK